MSSTFTPDPNGEFADISSIGGAWSQSIPAQIIGEEQNQIAVPQDAGIGGSAALPEGMREASEQFIVVSS